MTPAQLEELQKKAQACVIALRKSEIDDDGEVSAATVEELEHELQELCADLVGLDFRVSDAQPHVIAELCRELLRCRSMQ